jgi:predicted RecB family nuclease
MITNYPITPELVTAYWLCPRKGFLMLRDDTSGSAHEYVKLIEALASGNLMSFLEILRLRGLSVQQSEDQGQAGNADAIAHATLKAGDLEAKVDALVRMQHGSSEKRELYEPYLVAGTQTITREQKLRLAFIGYILATQCRDHALTGTIVNSAGDVSRIQLTKLFLELGPIIDTFRIWKVNLPSQPPPIILNDHCPICPFKKACLDQAETEDNLSLLDRMTPKIMQKYHKKGIFTVNQLSYLLKPRRQRKRSAHIPLAFNLELQALTLRTRKIYVHQPPSIPVHPTELFLDIEGIPDHGAHYLIGLIVSTQGGVECHSLWADSPEDEPNIFLTFLRIAEEHPGPIYHYGSYEPKGLERIAKKYNLACDQIKRRLINVNSFIFGKVYFLTRSNTLKDLGRFIGGTWSSPDASGLQSVVW